jgi:integrase
MPRMNFTAASVAAIKPHPNDRVDYWDTNLPGFGLRIAPSGVRTWMYWYRVGRQARRWTIARVEKLSLADARDRVRRSYGTDPAAQKTEAREARTVGDLVVEYLRVHAPTKKTGHRDQWIADKDILPKLRNVAVRDVKRQHIQKLLDDIRDPGGRNAPGSVLPVRRLLSKLWNFAIPREGYGVEYNIVTRTDAPKPGRRTRNLTDVDLTKLLAALDAETAAGHRLTATWLHLILLTGQRPGEVLSMRWDALDIFAPGSETRKSGFWDVRVSKNGDPINAALSREAVRVLRALREWSLAEHERIEANMSGRRPMRPMSAFVFPAGRGKRDRQDGQFVDAPMCGMLSNAVDRVRDRMGVQDWQPRDLRRTCRTLMSKLGIARDIAERVLNHTDNTINSVYDRYDFQVERLDAVNRVGSHLAKLTRSIASAA